MDSQKGKLNISWNFREIFLQVTLESYGIWQKMKSIENISSSSVINGNDNSEQLYRIMSDTILSPLNRVSHLNYSKWQNLLVNSGPVLSLHLCLEGKLS